MDILEKSRQLIQAHFEELNLGRKLKANYLLTQPQDAIDFFDSSFEHISDIYQVRLETNKMFGNYTDGLEELMQKIAENKTLPEIRVTNLDSKIYHALLFSNPDYSIFLGLLVFPPLEELYEQSRKRLQPKT